MPKNALLLAIVSVVFLALGVMTGALGPVLPDLAGNTGASLAGVGAVFTALFLGALLAQLVSGPSGDRVGMRWVVLGGMFLLAFGTLGFTFSRSLAPMLALALLAGLGHGAVNLGGNMLIARSFEKRSVSAVNLLNVFFGLGAFIGPTIASLSFRTWQTGLPAMWVSAAMFILLLPALLFFKTGTDNRVKISAGDHPGAQKIYRSPLLWGLGILTLVYVGTENGVGGWVTTYMDGATSMSIDQAAMVSAGFWLALTAGRMVSTILGLHASSRALLASSLALAGVSGVLFVSSAGNTSLSTAAILLAGFSFGPVYPTTLALTAATFPSGPGKAGSVVSSFGSIGGMLIPWLTGVGYEFSGPAAIPWFAMAGSLLMFALFAVVQLVQRRRASRASAGQPV